MVARFRLLGIIVGALALTFYLYGPNLDAGWGYIDDHEIVSFLGSDHVMHWREFWPRLMGTEIGTPGQFVRYRPVYYTLRLMETVLWRDSSFSWYFVRLLSIALAVGITGALLTRWLGFLCGMGVTVWIASCVFWGDIYCRLGPGEIYAALGTALFVYGAIFLFNGNAMSRLRVAELWCLTGIGCLLAFGSKENFLFMLPVFWILGWVVWRKYRLRAVALTGVIIVTAIAALITWAVGTALLVSGHDVYARSINISDRTSFLGMGRSGLIRQTLWYMKAWQLIGCFFTFCIVSWVVFKRKSIPSYVIRATVACLGLGVLYVIQFVFYNGELPSGMRYDFPAHLVVPLFWATIGWMLICIAADQGGSHKGRVVISGLMVCALILIIINEGGMSKIREGSERNAKLTQHFTSAMTNVAGILRANPSTPLTLVARDARDTEKVLSVALFLRYYGATNSFFLEVQQEDKIMLNKKLSDDLVQRLRDISQRGDRNYSPLAVRTTEGFSLGLSKVMSAPGRTLGFLNEDWTLE